MITDKADLEYEYAQQDYYDNNPIPKRCGECPEFTSGEFYQDSPYYEIGICEAYAKALMKNGESLGEAILTFNTRPCPYMD